MRFGIMSAKRNEAVSVFALCVLAIVAYSFWGAHLLRSQAQNAPAGVVTTGR